MQAGFIISLDNEIRLVVKKNELNREFTRDEIEDEECEYTINEAAMVKLKEDLLEELQNKMVCSQQDNVFGWMQNSKFKDNYSSSTMQFMFIHMLHHTNLTPSLQFITNNVIQGHRQC